MDAYDIGRKLAATKGSRYSPLSTNIHYQSGFYSRSDAKRKKCGPTAIACGDTCISDDKDCLYGKYGATLEKVEKDLVFKEKEELSFIDPNTGKEIKHIKGEESYVIIPDGMEKKLKGTIATHNHPAMGFAPGEPRSAGASFSAADISVGCHYKLREIRAVSPGYRFSMKPPDEGWDDEFFRQKVVSAYNRNMTKNYLKNMAMIGLGFRDYRKAQLLVHHETWKDTAKETGMKYSMQRIPSEKLQPKTLKQKAHKGASDLFAGVVRARGLALTGMLAIYAIGSLPDPDDPNVKRQAEQTKRFIKERRRR